MKPGRDALAALADKYRRMLRMRQEDAAGEADDPRSQMRELAERFPGALREIDELRLEVIEQRIEVLEAALRGDAELPEWAGWLCSYHGWMRAALRIKRLLAEHPADDPLELVGSLYQPAVDEPSRERLNADALAAIAQPPGGRLNPWVLDQVALDHGADPQLIRLTLFRK